MIIIIFYILRYIYIGEIDLTELSCKYILKLLIVLDELLIGELFNHAQNQLITVLLVEGNYKIIGLNRFFSSQIKKFFLNYLRKDDLQTNEIVVWDRLFEWALVWEMKNYDCDK